MKHLLEFHDSEIQGYLESSGNLTIRMSACIHASEVNPGVAQGISYYQDATIALTQYEPIFGTLQAHRISEGFIFDLQNKEVCLNLPLSYDSPSTIVIAFTNGSIARLFSSSLSIRTEGPKSNVEVFVP